MDRFKRNGREIFRNASITGIVLFIISYGGLYAAIVVFPNFFVDYINPIFNSDGSRDLYFYLHPFVLALSLSVFWNRFRKMFGGNLINKGIEFGIVYAFVALIPIMWITYAAMDVGFQMVTTWLIYGLIQACIAGAVLAKISPHHV
ncbi:MAG: hypothetical protein IPO92_03170 [Saprospiraceae bacterium]|nr:hypothetical protein [Saprospiraceae bacterium]